MIRTRDRGARGLLSRLFTKRLGFLDVGILGDDGADEEAPGITVADVARWAEFGIGQPQRSWLRAWVDENEAEIQKRISAEYKKIVKGQITKEQALKRIGAWAVGSIQQRIANRIPPPNAPSTVRQKGSSTPLVDKGQFRSSINYKIGDD